MKDYKEALNDVSLRSQEGILVGADIKPDPGFGKTDCCGGESGGGEDRGGRRGCGGDGVR